MENSIQNNQHWKVLVLFLKQIAEDKGISQEEISKKTGFAQSNISRMFSLSFCPTLKNFLSLAQAIGVNFYFEDKEGKSELNIAFEKAMEELGRRPDKLSKN